MRNVCAHEQDRFRSLAPFDMLVHASPFSVYT